ncbi:MAG TPA: nucleotidyltransferase family protein [Vicinamibacterales bacterium]|nr:nucleotidyltransferase family protein [Vicinamibacterales bacterium]
MSLPVAILAGGLATRLGPVTERIPKALVDVAGRPFAEHQIALLARHGLTDIVWLTGHLGTMIEEALGDGSRFGVRLRYVPDGPAPLGTGGAIRAAIGSLGDAFFVLYGDSYLECDYARIAHAFLGSGRSGLMTVLRNDDRWDRSNVRFEDGRILAYSKGDTGPEFQHIDYGLGVFHARAFAGYHSTSAFDLAAVYQRLLVADDLAAWEVHERFYEIGSPAGLADTRAHLSGGTERNR